MGFLKENVTLFLRDNADELSAEVLATAKKAIETLPAEDLLPAATAEKVFGDSVVADWFLDEISCNYQHMALAGSLTGKEKARASMKGTAEVLIVDDDPSWRHDLVDALVFAGIQTTCALAENGLDAQRILGQEPNVKVVITDLNMPGMDGIDLTNWIKINRPGVVVILRSTIRESDRAVAQEASGADHVIDKADNTKVVEEIRKVIVPRT